jgi:hypothetical protein
LYLRSRPDYRGPVLGDPRPLPVAKNGHRPRATGTHHTQIARPDLHAHPVRRSSSLGGSEMRNILTHDNINSGGVKLHQAYRGYHICYNPLNSVVWIEKDGLFICYVNNTDTAKHHIDQLEETT